MNLLKVTSNAGTVTATIAMDDETKSFSVLFDVYEGLPLAKMTTPVFETAFDFFHRTLNRQLETGRMIVLEIEYVSGMYEKLVAILNEARSAA